MMPDEHYQDIKRMINATCGHARKITVVMPYLYQSRQDKRDSRESLDCAVALDELKNMGIQIAIDDFGTGYSSLSYLNRFPANLLKIDKSFIDEMNMSDSSRQYVAAIISMGHIMGFDVISEGVEDPEQLKALKDVGCDFVQGFIWGRPLSSQEVEKLIADTEGK